MKTKSMLCLFAIIAISVFSFLPQAIAGDEDTKFTIDWKETTHDFGKVELNGPASITFEFTNGGEVPVILTSVKASCGCTTTSYTKTPVKPGEIGTIEVTYNSKKAGNFSKTVKAYFADNETPVMLHVKGKVVE